jgi:hypothetical protein
MRQSAHEHEYFEELSAAALMGQISAQEQQELLSHLGECDICRRSADDFVYVLGQLPLTAPSDIRAGTEDLAAEIRRQTFVKNASERGIRLSTEAVMPRQPVSASIPISHRRVAKLALVAASLLTAAGLLGLLGRLKSAAPAVYQKPVVAQASVPPLYRTEKATQVSASQEGNQGSAPATVAARNSERELASLKLQVAQLIEERARLADTSENLKSQVSQLKENLNQNAEALSEANAKYTTLSNENTLAVHTIVAQKTAIEQLQKKEASQAADAEREHQLNEAANEIRQLMGARNLHIIDVHDLVAPNKQDSAFGRIFYEQGKSLVFYAFDLGKNASKSKVKFQAWGHKEGRDSDVTSLGAFNVDHDAEKRWVLHVDDPVLLSKIDTIYVTVEPAPGRNKPSGHKLLVAYLGGQPNHP